MKFFITLASLAYIYAFDITLGGSCACSSLSYQADCVSNAKCQWSNSACTNVNCSSISTQSGCNFASPCAWVNGTCSSFSKCSDYSSNANVSCSEYGSGCNTTTTTNGTGVNCQDRTTVSSGSISCSTLSSSSTTCNALSICFYSGSTCRTKVCSDITDSLSCTATYSSDFKTLKICSWSGTACADSANLSSLNATTCYYTTQGMYTWNSGSSTCVQCSSNAYILLGLLSVLLI